MATEWGITKFRKDRDVKFRITQKDNGAIVPIVDMPDFTLKFYIENRETQVVTATKAGGALTGCYEDGGYIFVNIPADTFAEGKMVIERCPEIADASFSDNEYNPSRGVVTNYYFF